MALICSACTPPHLYGLPPRLGQPNAHAERNQRRRLCRLPAANKLNSSRRTVTVAAFRFPRPSGAPIVPLPRNRLALSAAGGASAVSSPHWNRSAGFQRGPHKLPPYRSQPPPAISRSLRGSLLTVVPAGSRPLSGAANRGTSSKQPRFIRRRRRFGRFLSPLRKRSGGPD